MSKITLIMKTTFDCNLRCRYCYNSNTKYSKGVMTESILEQVIKLAQEEFDDVQYIWHGGEPLLCGISFFEKAETMQKKYAKSNGKYSNIIQSNGTLLTQEYCSFIKKKKFKLGISFDGPDNNEARKSTQKVLKAIELAKSMNVDFGCVSVIHGDNFLNQIHIYEYFKSIQKGAKLNPVFEAGALENNTELKMDITAYISSLKTLFDYWIFDSNAVDIEPLNQYLKMAMMKKTTSCNFSSCLFHWLGVDSNGDLFPCGRDYEASYNLGNILKIEKIRNAFESDGYKRLISESIIRREKCRNLCELFNMCQGGCNNNAMHENGITEIDGFSCKVTKEMVEYIKNQVEELIVNKGTNKCNPYVIEAIKSNVSS